MRAKKEEEESPAKDLKWLHISQVKQTDVFMFLVQQKQT